VIWRLARRNLRSSPLRLVLISLAVILGVGFVAGAFVLGDTISHSIDGVFQQADAGVAVQVQPITSSSALEQQTVPASLLPTIEAVNGVASAAGTAGGIATIIGANGKAAGVSGAQTLGSGWVSDPALTALRLVSGRAPTGPDDVVVDTRTAAKEHFAVGQHIRVITQAVSDTYTLVGLVRFGTTDNLLGTTLAAFSMPTAQQNFNLVGQYNTIDVSGKQGVLDSVLAQRVQAVLPAGYKAITGSTAIQQSSDQFNSVVGILRDILLVFAGISLFVGAFIIFNSFSITIAQRTRQVGLLRALGASSGSVVREVILEALIIGLAASIIGVGFGILVALGLESLFRSFGFNLPPAPLQVEPRSVIVALAVGIGVTVIACLRPAIRASRIPPIAALREVSLERGHGLRRVVVALSVTALGVALVLVGLFGGKGNPYVLLGAGALLLFIGAALLTEQIARPLARIIGAPFVLIGGVSGRLGRANVMRNPARAAQTATALTIGVALVAAASIFAASLSATYVGEVDSQFLADVAVLTTNSQPFSAAAILPLEHLPELTDVTAWRDDDFRDVHNDVQGVTGVPPKTIGSVFNPDMIHGSFADLAAPDSIAVQSGYAKDNHLVVGDTMSAFFQKSGTRHLRVVAIFSQATYGQFFISLAEFAKNSTIQQDSLILARASPGVSPTQARDAVTAALVDFPTLTAYTKAGYTNMVSSQVNQLLYLVYLMLGLAVIIAVFGIVNTLALSIFERTREIGMLRAIGMSRRATRAMIRWEAIIIALIGGIVGLVLGVFLGIVIVERVSLLTTLSVPWTSLVIFLVLAGVAGVIAAIFPARRAARLEVLKAIQAE
jgi:putative ABC transport system permease protein